MFFLILSHLFCEKLFHIPDITEITDKNYKSIIEKRKKGETWILIFYGDFCPACKSAEPEFKKAAMYAAGNIHFGAVNTQYSVHIAQKNGITFLPSYKIFTNNSTVIDYSGGRDHTSILKALNPYFKGCLSSYQESWFSESKYSAILYTSSSDIPFRWKSISCSFQKKYLKNFRHIPKIRFGHSSNSSARISHGSFLVPVIFAMNKTNTLKITSLTQFEKTLQDFFIGNYSDLNVNINYLLPFELNSECQFPTQYCIAISTDNYVSINQQYKDFPKNLNIKLFQGTQKWPIKQIEEDQVWIIEAGLKKGVKIPQNDLSIELNKIANGQSELNWIDLEIK